MRPDPHDVSHSGPRPSPRVRPAHVVVVASGRAGVGTSVCAALLALECASLGGRVLLIDGHEGHGTLHSLFGVRPVRLLESLRDPHVGVNDVCTALGDAFTLVACAPTTLGLRPFSRETHAAPWERLLPLSADYDCVIVDAGSRLDNIRAIATSGAGRAVLVTDTDPISLAATFALIKALHADVPALASTVLVNRREGHAAECASAQIADACSHFLAVDIPLAGCVPDDASLSAAIGAGMLVGDAGQGSPAAAAMQPVARTVFPFLADVDVATPASSPPHALRRRSSP